MKTLKDHIKEIEEEFDKEFPHDTLVSAHQDWTYDALKRFYTTQSTKHITEILEGLKEEDKICPVRSISHESEAEGNNNRNHRLNTAINNLLNK